MGEEMTYMKERRHAISIRPATPEDAREIRSMAAAVRLYKGAHPESGEEGFLIFVPSQEEYARRLSGTKTALIAFSGEDIAGYVLAYRSAEFAAAGKADDPVIRRISAREPGPFVYIDQIVVKPPYRRRGIARLLIRHLGRLAPGHPGMPQLPSDR